jgi:hypothetical protein
MSESNINRCGELLTMHEVVTMSHHTTQYQKRAMMVGEQIDRYDGEVQN